MTPKQKAVDLFNDYYSYLKANLMYDEEARQDAKVCALIAVDEILDDDMYGMGEEDFEKELIIGKKLKKK